MGLFRRNKFAKLKREEVVDAICKLEKQSQDIEEGLVEQKKQIDELMQKGRVETDRQLKLYYAKKINALKAEREQNSHRAMYLMYNTQLLNKLKNAIDDNQFFVNTSKVSLGNMLADQKGLADFLSKTLNTRMRAEDTLVGAEDTFKQVEGVYDGNQEIYGKSENDDELLAIFETEDMVAAEQEMYAPTTKAIKKEDEE